jgi:hypothetical protein
MEEIKLTIEDIKKACEFVDGFEILYHKVWENGFLIVCPSKSRSYYKDFIEDLTVYPLFLQRVIEGINRKDGMFMIRQNRGGLEIFHNVLDDIKDFYFIGTHDTDQAKTQAIKYILDQIKENPTNAN